MRDRADIIAAIATPPGRGGIGVVRVSGPALGQFTRCLLGRELVPRQATYMGFPDASGEPIDRGIAIAFAGPHSYTGEDVLELQGHGSPVVMAALLERCVACGARVAEPGEFTRRAYLNDRIDLVQAESVADLIEASNRAAARSAMRSLSGMFSDRIRALVREVTEARVFIEACLDFPEEEIDAATLSSVQRSLKRIQAEIDATRSAAGNGRLLAEGIQVALVGRPNVGKSSLLNRWVGEELAIVTPHPGTTRDTVRGSIAIGGVPVHLVDTAGLRATDDTVERIGVERSLAAAERADLVLIVRDASRPQEWPEMLPEGWGPDIARLTVWNKVDLAGWEPGSREGQVFVSALSGAGMPALQEAVLKVAGWQPGGEGEFSARARHVAALERAAAAVTRATGVAGAMELVAEELRTAQDALGGVTGEVTADDLLGEIFSRFCIGK
jgi:tRNA modification GTPase